MSARSSSSSRSSSPARSSSSPRRISMRTIMVQTIDGWKEFIEYYDEDKLGVIYDQMEDRGYGKGVLVIEGKRGDRDDPVSVIPRSAAKIIYTGRVLTKSPAGSNNDSELAELEKQLLQHTRRIQEIQNLYEEEVRKKHDVELRIAELSKDNESHRLKFTTVR